MRPFRGVLAGGVVKALLGGNRTGILPKPELRSMAAMAYTSRPWQFSMARTWTENLPGVKSTAGSPESIGYVVSAGLVARVVEE